MAAQRLRVGERVRSTSDLRAGRLGRIARRLGSGELDVETTSYLVCWEAGGESWIARAALHPLQGPEASVSRGRAPHARPARRLARAVRAPIVRARAVLLGR
jgi:hypothetical protein